MMLGVQRRVFTAGPLADHAGAVASLLEKLRDSDRIRVDPHLVLPVDNLGATGPLRIRASHKGQRLGFDDCIYPSGW